MARPSRPEPRRFEVTKSVRITPNMHRITLGGKSLNGFPENRAGGYIKFRLPTPEGDKPIVRTYTIRSQTAHGIDVDFALHGSDAEHSGPATRWALGAELGDDILVGGPGPAKPLPEGKGPFLLVGDMTALPAISVNLENLPDDATGHAIILIREEADKQVLIKPEGVTLQWIVETDLGAIPTLLVDAVRRLLNPQKLAYAWVACEFEAMKLLRQYLRTEQNFGKDRLYISSYWKRGLIEDEHKRIKRVDAEAV
ncbi:MAG: siderophore-interacting protein [Litorimonas sp.]